jgi:hypothetical protein
VCLKSTTNEEENLIGTFEGNNQKDISINTKKQRKRL